MKAVILPTGNMDLLHPLNDWVPEFLIPVVNKPVVVHLIELLVHHNIRDIVLILKHIPYETERFFEKGLRWGCNITYSLEREYVGVLSSLRPIRSRIDDSFLCLPWNIITDLDFSALMSAHQEGSGDITVPELRKWDYATDKKESFPFIMTPKALSMLLSSADNLGLGQIIPLSSDMGLAMNTFLEPFHYKTIHDVHTYIEINKLVLRGEFKGILIPGREIRPGLWVDRQSRIHPSAKLSSPALIGKLCNIRNGVHIGEDTIIGDNVIVDQGVSTNSSIVFDNTYIGSHTEIKDSIIRKNSIFYVPRLLNVYVGDDFILGDLDKKVIAHKMERLFNIVAALLLLVLFSPVMISFYIYHRLLYTEKYLDSEERYGSNEVFDLQGNVRPKVFDFFFFRSRHKLIAKLPGLFNVIKGDINLVGNSLLTRDQVESLHDEWETMRFKAPAGLFHLWEVEGGGKDLTWEEKIVNENYYASTRSFFGDLKILSRIFSL